MTDLHHIQVEEVKGISSKKSEHLQALGIHSVAELIEYFPFRYEDYRLRDLTEVEDGDKITIEGEIYGEPVVQMYGRNKSRLTCKVMVHPHLVTTVWFNRHFMKPRLKPGERIILTGKWDQRRLQLTVSESEFPGSHTAQTGTLQPVYSVAGAISQKWLRGVIKQALLQFGQMIHEILPAYLLEKYKLMPRKQAIHLIHHPGDPMEGKQARRRIVYEELFMFQLKLQAFRFLSRNSADGMIHDIDKECIQQFISTFPFQLTPSQKKVIEEVLHDLQQPYCMNRLLQGDVGSGKTIVASTALYAVVKAGCQGAFMVPTEILAEQHSRSLKQLFEPLGIEVGLLTGGLKERHRKEMLVSLQMGMVDIIVGTHALIQEDVYFKKLGLVVTDEQHRFGVNQRSILRRKGMNPDVLTMTATPIPRTLAITAFGDMDVSTLREMPQGRKPIQTYWVQHSMLERILNFMQKALKAGQQVYVVCPLIEESDKLDVQNAIDVYTQMKQTFGDFKVGLLHGRLPSEEKDSIMREFHNNELQLLVSTTVIEVGVDVPNSTIMLIYDADRFGLSQLHQLRGRVGRGEQQSYCILMADPKSEVGKARMKAMTETNDGFEISRRDLELRGPGDFFGTKQSGIPEFRMADMVSDFEILEIARDDSAELVAKTNFWTSASYISLRNYLQREQIFQGDLLD